MQLMVVGINHLTSNAAMREKFAVPVDLQQTVLSTMIEKMLAQVDTTDTLLFEKVNGRLANKNLLGLMLLSTCNRSECVLEYAELEQFLGADQAERVKGQALQFFAEISGLSVSDFEKHIYIRHGAEAMAHLISVATGLNSMVVGEPQILGQMKSSYSHALRADTINSGLDSILQHVFSVSKKVRHRTAIGVNPVSIAYAAVMLAQKIYDDFANAKVLLVGAGETIELVGRHLQQAGSNSVTVVNRTLSRAESLASKFSAKMMRFSDLTENLHQFDIVISSTASQLPVIGKGMVEAALKQRKRKPLFMVDIAIPRDIEEQVSELPDAYVYNVDDLKNIIDENIKLRALEAEKARLIIDQGVEDYCAGKRERGVIDLVVAYRHATESICESELQKAVQMLQHQPAEDVLELFARNLSRKLMHKPSVEIKNAAAQSDKSVLDAAKILFGLQNIVDDGKESLEKQ